MMKISKNKNIYGKPLPKATAAMVDRYIKLMELSPEREAPVKEPKTVPKEIPDSPPAPDKDSPWHVPGPKVNPTPKALIIIN